VRKISGNGRCGGKFCWLRGTCGGDDRPAEGARNRAETNYEGSGFWLRERHDGLVPRLPLRTSIETAGLCVCIALLSGCASGAPQFVRPDTAPSVHAASTHEARAPDKSGTQSYSSFMWDSAYALPSLFESTFGVQPASDRSLRSAGEARPYQASTTVRAEGAYADKRSETERLLSLDYGKLLLADTKHVLSAPLRWEKRDWLTVALATMGVAATASLDEPVRDDIADNKGTVADEVASFFDPLAIEYSFGVLGGFYLSGLAFDNPESRAVALDGLAAGLIATGIITPAIKFAIGRSRPQTEDGTQTFQPFSGNASFPSGHTTQAFAVASVIAEHYDPLWIDVTAYGVASMVGFARLEADMHFVSDVVAGALIGTVVGKAVVRFNEQQRDDHARTSASVMPLVGAGALGLKVNFSF